MFNKSLSTKAAKIVDAKPHQCYRNSAIAQGVFEGARYVEGFAVPNNIGLPLEHAWLETEDGFIIDPTWLDGAKYYLPCASYTAKQVSIWVGRNEVLPINSRILNDYIIDHMEGDDDSAVAKAAKFYEMIAGDDTDAIEGLIKKLRNNL